MAETYPEILQRVALMAHLPCVSVEIKDEEPADEAEADYQLLIAVYAMQEHLGRHPFQYNLGFGKPE